MMNQFKPQSIPHPGETLEEKLEEMGMGPKEFALRTNKPEKTITAVLKGESSITPDMAVQFENVTLIPATFWNTRQMNYDDFQARKKRKAVIDEAVAWANHFPLQAMEEKGWLPGSGKRKDQAAALLVFFGFANHHVWEKYYFDQQLKASFKISLAKIKEPYSTSAWLRKGELEAATLHAEKYSEKKFKEIILLINEQRTKKSEDIFVSLQKICLQAGVKVVVTASLPITSIKGCARWINDTPLIQLSGDLVDDADFWFIFFHEAGHILLHGKNDIFLEKTDYTENDSEKESQADNFAFKWINSSVQLAAENS